MSRAASGASLIIAAQRASSRAQTELRRVSCRGECRAARASTPSHRQQERVPLDGRSPLPMRGRSRGLRREARPRAQLAPAHQASKPTRQSVSHAATRLPCHQRYGCRARWATSPPASHVQTTRGAASLIGAIAKTIVIAIPNATTARRTNISNERYACDCAQYTIEGKKAHSVTLRAPVAVLAP
jgi:hypothetical protein